MFLTLSENVTQGENAADAVLLGSICDDQRQHQLSWDIHKFPMSSEEPHVRNLTLLTPSENFTDGGHVADDFSERKHMCWL